MSEAVCDDVAPCRRNIGPPRREQAGGEPHMRGCARGRRRRATPGVVDCPTRKGNRIRHLPLIPAVTLLLAGCYNPRGAFYPYVGQAATYWSTASAPTTITVIDTRTGEAFFTVEIPVGKQLVLDFKDGEGDDNVLTPDLMRYDVFPRGQTTGTLRNGITVPDRFSRRIDVTYRPAPEYADTSPDDPLRVDENRPDWWTPKGGPMPDNEALHIYDG